MSVETKVHIAIVCPICGKHFTLNKKKEVAKAKFTCPACQNTLHIHVNVKDTPQTFKLFTEEELKALEEKKKKTVYEKSIDGPKPDKKEVENSSDSVDSSPEEVDVHDDEAERKVVPKQKHHFHDHVFLTHIKCFGLLNQKYPLSEGKNIIGRYDHEQPSDISIKGDSTMSRQSVSITIEEEDKGFVFKLKVLNAANAVKINDIPVNVGHSRYLKFGDIIVLGNSKFRFDNQ